MNATRGLALATVLVLGGVTLVGPAGCGSGAEETPQEAIREMMALYEARDFDTLVRTRYAEIHKAENDAQIRQLVERLEALFAPDAELAKAVNAYETALKAEPVYSEDGTEVRFQVEAGFVKLSRMADGRWGFHL